MDIIIVGCGKVGYTLVEQLSNEEHNIVVVDKNFEKVICVPFIFLKDAKNALEDTEIKLGAQNMHWEESGAFTGEVGLFRN